MSWYSFLATRWMCCELDVGRSRKLRQTMSAVEQLEGSLSQLREWLASIESQLASPLRYSSPDFPEVERHLQRTQQLQADVEKHAAGVSSGKLLQLAPQSHPPLQICENHFETVACFRMIVLNLCEVLCHDVDACPTSSERDAIAQARRKLEHRWKQICLHATSRRIT